PLSTPSSERRLASASSITPVNHAPRWLTSSADAPTPGSVGRSLRTCSSTGSGRIPGPAAKLTMRSGTWPGYRRGSAADERAWETGRATVAVGAELGTHAGADLGTGTPHPTSGRGVPGEGRRDPGGERQHVGPHRGELGLGDLDDRDPPFLEQPNEPHGHHREVADDQVPVERRDERQQVEALRR